MTFNYNLNIDLSRIQNKDNIWLDVINLDKAISFWETILELKISKKEKDYAEFDLQGFILRLQPYGTVQPDMLYLKADNIKKAHKRIKILTKNITKIIKNKQDKYECFTFLDTEGNFTTVINYELV